MDAQSKQKTCQFCNEKIKQSSKFCPYCGKQLKKEVFLCQNCGNKIQSNQMFCSNCGEKAKQPLQSQLQAKGLSQKQTPNKTQEELNPNDLIDVEPPKNNTNIQNEESNHQPQPSSQSVRYNYNAFVYSYKVAKVFMIISLVFKVLLLISCIISAVHPAQPTSDDGSIVQTLTILMLILPFWWIIPMLMNLTSSIYEKKPVSPAFKICTLFFVNLIAGFILLCADDKPYYYYH